MLRVFSVRGIANSMARQQRMVHSMNPSEKTSLLLRRLPATVTSKELLESLKDVNCRKIELEPGCTIHVRSHAEAQAGADHFQSKLNLETQISSTTMPSLLLKNIPDSMNATDIRGAFAESGVKTVNIMGGPTFQIPAATAMEALKVSHAMNSAKIGDQQLMTRISKGIGEQYSVTVYNVPAGAAQSAVAKLLPAGCDASKLVSGAAVARTVVLRLDAKDTDKVKQVVAALAQLPGARVTERGAVSKPALFFRKVSHLEGSDIESLVRSHPNERIELVRSSKDGPIDMAVVYFANTENAFGCLAALKDTSVNGKKLSITYRDTFEPAVLVSGLPGTIKEAEVQEFFAAFDRPTVQLRKSPDGHKQAQVLLKTPAEVELARFALNKKMLGGNKVSVVASSVGDVGIEVRLSADSATQEESIKKSLEQCGVTAKSVTFQTNINAYLSFMTAAEAERARETFVQGKISALKPMSTSGTLISSQLTASPSFSLSLSNVSGETSVQELLDSLSSEAAAVDVLGSDRSALVKFRRHKDVVPGIKAIKKLRVPMSDVEEGSSVSADNMWANLRVQKYRPLASVEQAVDYLPSTAVAAARESEDDFDEGPAEGNSSFRGRSPGFDEAFDQFSLRAVMKDYMSADPSTRYELARNAFERALSDARSTKDASYLLGSNPSAALKKEVSALIEAPGGGGNQKGRGKGRQNSPLEQPLTTEATQRLFELFLQREDMAKFSSDFKELSAFFGAADEDDAFNWSQFKTENAADMERMLRTMKEKEEEEMEALLRRVHKHKNRFSEDAAAAAAAETAGMDGETEEGKRGLTITVEGERRGEETAVISLAGSGGDAGGYDDPNTLKDKDGNFWSGVILNSDIVQRVSPGDRVNSQRVLVVVGNMRGAAGFGMGKGKTAADALKGAFRSALRNLTHIDLYDNFGLAHDLHGKHNSCHAYIKATPRSREMVASPFATEILTRFGIGSASVKLVGRRDPYAMVRAVFNALEQHENIDEYAKDRGKRYLTLKWAHDQNL